MAKDQQRLTGSQRAERYVRHCLRKRSNVPELVRLAAQRHRKDKKNKLIRFDVGLADAAIANIEQFVHAKGEMQGRPVHLEDWECFFVASIFGWVWVSTGLRRFRYAVLLVPRKNGKTFLTITIGLSMLAFDNEPGAEVYLGATTQDQARELLFYPAKYIAENTEGFAHEFGIECGATTLVRPKTFSRLRSVIGRPDDGFNPHMACCDEYHQHLDNTQYRSFATGMGARRQPLLMVPSTAGFTLSGPCKAERDECVKMLQGAIDIDTKFALIYEPDEGDDWADINTAIKVNPNVGITVSREFLESELHIARMSAIKQSDYRTLHLNQWVGARTVWMNMLRWQKQARKLSLDDFENERCWIGVDLAARVDVAAVCLLFKRGDIYYCFMRFWAPEDANNDKYKMFALSGDLILTPGPRTDFEEIQQQIDEDCRRFTVESVAFDPYQSQQMMQGLQKLGVNVVEYAQQVRYMSDPMKEVEAAVLDGKLEHDGNACMTWMVGNVTAKLDAKDNVYPRKENDGDPNCKIDGPVALIMAMGRALADEDGGLNDFLDNPVIV